MNWLPYENYYIISPLSSDEVRLRLEKHVSPPFTGNFLRQLTNRYSTYYKGFVNNSEFKIEPIIEGRNSFIPQIAGNIKLAGSGSRIHIKMTLLEPVMIFIGIVSVFIGIATIAALIDLMKSKHLEPAFLAPIGMMIFIYALTIYGFTSESISSKKFLLELFEAEYE